MASSLAWLDYSERERRKLLDVVNLFRDRNTLDELGVGTVRDTFSNLLFPGTSTLHTRTRYVLFIPWIYQAIEGSKAKSKDPWWHARRAELALMDALAESKDGDRKSTRLNSSHVEISYAVFCLKKKKILTKI